MSIPLPEDAKPFLEGNISEYSETVISSIDKALDQYAQNTAEELGIVKKSVKFHGRLGKIMHEGGTSPAVVATRLTCQRLMVGIVKKIRKDMPHIGPNVIGVQDGISAPNAAKFLMVLHYTRAVEKYITRIINILRDTHSPLCIHTQTCFREDLQNPIFQRICDNQSLPNDHKILVLVVDLSKSAEHFEYIESLSIDGSLSASELPNIRTTSTKSIDLARPCPQLVYSMSYFIKSVKTLTRRLLCFPPVQT